MAALVPTAVMIPFANTIVPFAIGALVTGTIVALRIATVAFTFTKAPMAEGDRLRNPLGFQVTSYRSDAEVVR